MMRKNICYNSFTTCSRNSDRKILFLLFLFIFTQEKENYYAKKQVSGSYFYNYHGIFYGLCHDLLQHCLE